MAIGLKPCRCSCLFGHVSLFAAGLPCVLLLVFSGTRYDVGINRAIEKNRDVAGPRSAGREMHGEFEGRVMKGRPESREMTGRVMTVTNKKGDWLENVTMAGGGKSKELVYGTMGVVQENHGLGGGVIVKEVKTQGGSWVRGSTGKKAILPRIRQAASSDYIVFFTGFNDGRGLGNQLFNVAALIYFAALSGRTAVLERSDVELLVERTFNLTTLSRLDAPPCPCYDFSEQRPLAFDPRFEALGQPGNAWTEPRTIQLKGFYQSWRYVRPVEARLRDLLQFNVHPRECANWILYQLTPRGWTVGEFVRVAVHVRRGDNLRQDIVDFGYTTADAAYFQKAMSYFVNDAYPTSRVQFLVVSQDDQWARDNILAPAPQPPPTQAHPRATGPPTPPRVDVSHVHVRTQANDLAIMAACDHVIMSTGTFGWWAGWLANGTTVYCSDWPRNGSQLAEKFVREDFFPPHWIGLSGSSEG